MVRTSSRRARSRATLAVGVVVALALTAAPPLGSASAEPPPSDCAWSNPAEAPEDRAAKLLAAMSLDDKVQMVTGIGLFNPTSPNPGASGVIRGNPDLCLPHLVLNDSSGGIGFQQKRTTAFPQGITQASTWNRELIRTFGGVLADEAMRKGVNVVLGPGLNMSRNPLSGRNLEYAGEDPYVAGQLGAELIEGIQSRPVMANAKHFILNEQEIDRTTNSSEVDERTLRQIYLPPFEDAIDAGVGSFMCAYNRVASVHACESEALLQDLLKDELGFDGFVLSDWMATHSTAPAANAGLDMEMPGDGYFGISEAQPAQWGPNLKAAVLDGSVPQSRLDDMVRRILTPMFRLGLFEHPPITGNAASSAVATTDESLALATQMAQEGAVLLKNDDGMLPLEPSMRRIAVIGLGASKLGAQLSSQGFGSNHVPVFGLHPDVVAPLAAIKARAKQDDTQVLYDSGALPLTAALTAANADVAIVFVSSAETEANDRPDLQPREAICNPLLNLTQIPNFPTCIPLPTFQDALVSAVAKANPNTVVVLKNGGPLEMPWLDSVDAVVESWYPGQVDGNAITGLLFGDVNFSGKLPVTFPKKLADGPLRTPEQYPGVTGPDGIPRSTYSEGVFIGYRWYQEQQIEPLFPFGFGLSYTDFDFSELTVTPTSTGAQVTARVTNTGQRAGAEVAQLYVAFPSAAGEPPRQLKGFEKVALDPGQSALVAFELDERAFSIWDDGWRVVPGRYGIHVGNSSESLPLTGSIDLPAAAAPDGPTGPPPTSTLPDALASGQSAAVDDTVEATVAAARSGRGSSGRVTRARLRAGEPVRVRTRLIQRGRVVAASRSGWLAPGRTALRLRIPERAAAGPAMLRMRIRDRAGNVRQVTRRVQIPRSAM